MMYISYYTRAKKEIEKLHFFAEFFENRIFVFLDMYGSNLSTYPLNCEPRDLK